MSATRSKESTDRGICTERVRLVLLTGLLLSVLAASPLATTAAAQSDDESFSIDGSVETGLERPVEGVQVTLKEQLGQSYAERATAETDGEGSYAFDGLPGGHYLVTFTYGGIPYSQRINLRGDRVADFSVDRVMDGGAVGGKIVEGSASPVPVEGVELEVLQGGELLRTTETGPDGVYLVQGLNGSADYEVRLQRNGTGYTRSIGTDDDPLTFERADFEFTASISGNVREMVTGETGPYRSTGVHLLHGGETIRVAETDGEGDYTFRAVLANEPYEVRLQDHPYWLEVSTSGDVTDANLTVYRSAPLRIEEKQFFLKNPKTDSGGEVTGYTIQQFIIIDQESLIANSEVIEFRDGVATVNVSLTQPLPAGTRRAFSAPMMGQGVGSDTLLQATVRNGTAVLNATRYRVDLSAGEQDLGATYNVDRAADGGILEKTLPFSQETEYLNDRIMLVNRIGGDGMHSVNMSLDAIGTQNEFNNFVLNNVSAGTEVAGKVRWSTYETPEVRTTWVAAAASLLAVLAALVWRRRRER